jgi:AraC-like DNA-binding protein
MGLAEIAVQLGFADQAHFQRHFKQRHAISPLRYLRQ